MRNVRHLCLFVATLCNLPGPAVATEGVASAPTPPREPTETARNEVGLALLGGFGWGERVDDNRLNRYAAGFGLRGGVTLGASRLYLGGSFVRFLGRADASGRYFMTTVDAELGYDLRFFRQRLVVRPEVAFGAIQAVAIQSDNAGYPLVPHLAPGLLLGLRLPPILVSAEGRRDTILADGPGAVTILLGAGAIF